MYYFYTNIYFLKCLINCVSCPFQSYHDCKYYTSLYFVTYIHVIFFVPTFVLFSVPRSCLKIRVYIEMLNQIFIYWLYVWLPLHSRRCVWLYIALVTDPPSRCSQLYPFPFFLYLSSLSPQFTMYIFYTIRTCVFANSRNRSREGTPSFILVNWSEVAGVE